MKILDLLVIILLAVVLFGGSRLPDLGKGLGQGIRNFRRGLRGEDAGAGGVDGAAPLGNGRDERGRLHPLSQGGPETSDPHADRRVDRR